MCESQKENFCQCLLGHCSLNTDLCCCCRILAIYKGSLDRLPFLSNSQKFDVCFVNPLA